MGAGLLALAGIGSGLAGGCAQTAGRRSSSAPTGPAALDSPQPFEPLGPLAPGVWLARGQGGEVDPANLGRIGNVGLLVGSRGAVVVDSGVSRHHGEWLLAAARQLSPQPLRALLLTHVRQEFVFGASAFQDAGVPVVMHPVAAGLMRARCETCLKNLQRLLGPQAMAGSRVVTPDRLLDAGDPWLAEQVGRPLRLLAWGAQAHSSGPGDLALFDESTGSLCAGGLVDADTIPDVQDADFSGWRQALAELARLPLRHILPGHGPAVGPQQLQRIGRYLDALESRSAALLAAGVPLSEVADATELPEFAGWDQYDTVHRRNASIVYLRLERELLRQPAKESP